MIILFAFLALFIADTEPSHASEHSKKEASSDHAPHGSEKPHAAHWTYGGEEGPENWGKISPEYQTCEQGKLQSPVDLKWKKQNGQRSIELHYRESNYSVVDNGHTIQVNVPAGSYAIIDGMRYELAQFHFHAASEHTFSGKHFPLEAHFVHKNAEGKLAVVGVMFDAGKTNTSLDKIFQNVPKHASGETKVNAMFNPTALIPSNHSHYQYSGSLTTPPCSEGVNWTVMNTPQEISEEQIHIFNEYYVHNNRPIQPIHQRTPASF